MISIEHEDIIRRLFKARPDYCMEEVDSLREDVEGLWGNPSGITHLEAWDAMVAVCREWLETKGVAE